MNTALFNVHSCTNTRLLFTLLTQFIHTKAYLLATESTYILYTIRSIYYMLHIYYKLHIYLIYTKIYNKKTYFTTSLYNEHYIFTNICAYIYTTFIQYTYPIVKLSYIFIWTLWIELLQSLSFPRQIQIFKSISK